jgi:hypothetical protein
MQTKSVTFHELEGDSILGLDVPALNSQMDFAGS